MADKYTVEFSVSGNNFDLASVTLEQIGGFLTSLQKVIHPIVVKNNPSRSFQEDDVIVSLLSLKKSSLDCQFETQYETEVREAMEITADALRTENYSALPLESIEGLREIVRFNRHFGGQTMVRQLNGRIEDLAMITPQTRINGDNFISQGTSTLYGYLMRIGGDNPPRAYMRFINGKRLSCRIKSIALAQRMAPLLYQKIGIRGIAKWDTRDMSLYDFRIEDLTPFREKSLRQSIDSLREVAGVYFNEDLDLDELRGTSESD